MSEYGVLHSEPRHKVDEFVDEMLGRARKVIAAMAPTFEALLKDMIAQFQTFREQHYLITLDGVRFDQIRWTRDGRLVIDFSVGPRPSSDPDAGRHEVIDTFVDDIVGRTVPEALRSEFTQFVRGMVTQFAALDKHALIDLHAVAFDRIAWVNDRQMAIRMSYHGKPFLPCDVGLS